MATIRVRFHVPDGEYCTEHNNKCRFRSLGYIKDDRYIIKCHLFDVDLINQEYESRDKKAEVFKCDQCLNARISGKPVKPGSEEQE